MPEFAGARLYAGYIFRYEVLEIFSDAPELGMPERILGVSRGDIVAVWQHAYGGTAYVLSSGSREMGYWSSGHFGIFPFVGALSEARASKGGADKCRK